MLPSRSWDCYINSWWHVTCRFASHLRIPEQLAPRPFRLLIKPWALSQVVYSWYSKRHQSANWQHPDHNLLASPVSSASYIYCICWRRLVRKSARSRFTPHCACMSVYMPGVAPPPPPGGRKSSLHTFLRLLRYTPRIRMIQQTVEIYRVCGQDGVEEYEKFVNWGCCGLRPLLGRLFISKGRLYISLATKHRSENCFHVILATAKISAISKGARIL